MRGVNRGVDGMCFELYSSLCFWMSIEEEIMVLRMKSVAREGC